MDHTTPYRYIKLYIENIRRSPRSENPAVKLQLGFKTEIRKVEDSLIKHLIAYPLYIP